MRFAVAMHADVDAAARYLFTPQGRRTSPRGDAFLATGAREDHAVNGERIATWRFGSGPLVLCMHGWGGSAAQFASIVPALVARGCSVVAIDGPGHGHSTGEVSSIVAMRDALIALARLENAPVSMVAHSGGAASAVLAMTAGVAVDRFVFIGPTVDPGHHMELYARSLHYPDDLLAQIRDLTTRRFGMPWTGLRILPIAPNRTEPLLVVHDHNDEEVAFAEGRDLAAAWPQAQLLATVGLGHRRVLYDSGVADAVARFVAASDLS